MHAEPWHGEQASLSASYREYTSVCGAYGAAPAYGVPHRSSGSCDGNGAGGNGKHDGGGSAHADM